MKVITKLFGTLIKAALALLILTLLAPILFFAWRMNQPMDMSEFKGLTYVQFMEWRQMGFEDLAVKYEQLYPNGMPNHGGNKVKHGQCFGTRVGIDALRATNSAFYVLLTQKRPFFSTWWQTFEEWVWSGVEADPHGPVEYCRLQPNIPTPEQYEIMKQERVTTIP